MTFIIYVVVLAQFYVILKKNKYVRIIINKGSKFIFINYTFN